MKRSKEEIVEAAQGKAAEFAAAAAANTTIQAAVVKAAPAVLKAKNRLVKFVKNLQG